MAILIAPVYAWSQITDLNGTIKATNNYSSGEIHATAKVGIRVKTNDTRHRYGMNHRNVSERQNMGDRTGAKRTKNRYQPVISHREKTNYCAEYVRNVTELKKLSAERHRYNIGKRLDVLRARVILAGMNATINKAQEYNANTSGLISIRDRFMQEINELNKSTDTGYRARVHDIVMLVVRFRKEAHKIPELDQHTDEVKTAVIQAMDKERNKIKQVMMEEIRFAEKVGLAVFDLHVCMAEQKLRHMAEMGINTTEAEIALSNIKTMRQELINAYESGNRTKVAIVKSKIAKKWRDVYKAFVEMNGGLLARKYVRARSIILPVIQKLKQRGVDVSDIENKMRKLDEEAKMVKTLDDQKRFMKGFNELNKELAKKIRANIRPVAVSVGGRAKVKSRFKVVGGK